jgi:maleylacetate reductase
MSRVVQFIYNQFPSRVVFGVGALERLRDEAQRIGVKSALVLCTPGQKALAAKAVTELGPLAIGIYDRAAMHVPKELSVEASGEALRRKADCTVAIGGGSTVGLAKAVSLETGLPSIAVPTTYAGSEMTTIYGLTEGGLKRTGRDARVLPKVTIYDPLLTLSVPPRVAGPSGLNAIAHCVEALYAPDANPVTSLLAEEGIRSLTKYLPTVVREPHNIEARSGALYGAWLAGSALGAVAMALHHKLCHTLGGAFNLPHAETHAVLLPHVVRYNSDHAKEAIARLSRALGEPDPAFGLLRLAETIGAPLSLKSLGLTEAQLERAADLALENPYYNPRPIERSGIRILLENAYLGGLPEP